MKFLVIYSLSLLFLSVFADPTCPSVTPCKCQKMRDIKLNWYLKITCSQKSTTLDQLANVLSVLDKSYPIYLTLNGLNLGSVPSDFFASPYIKHLEIMQCHLKKLSEPGEKPFTGLEDKIESLKIFNSLWNTTLELSHLRKLTYLDLPMNTFYKLGNGLFPDSLTGLFLRTSIIQELGDKAFENLHNLESLALSGNPGVSLRRSMLPNPANALSYLELNNIDISSAPDDFFTNMPNLSELYAQSSGIRIIKESVFKPIWTQLNLLNLYDNPLQCDSNIEWIRHLETKADIGGTCASPPDVAGVELDDFIINKKS